MSKIVKIKSHPFGPIPDNDLSEMRLLNLVQFDCQNEFFRIIERSEKHTLWRRENVLKCRVKSIIS